MHWVVGCRPWRLELPLPCTLRGVPGCLFGRPFGRLCGWGAASGESRAVMLMPLFSLCTWGPQMPPTPHTPPPPSSTSPAVV